MQANMSMWERIGFQSLCSVGGRPARVDFSPSSDVALEGASSSRPDSRAPVVDVPPAVALAGTSRRSKDSTTEPHITLEGASSSRPDSRAPVVDVPPAVALAGTSCRSKDSTTEPHVLNAPVDSTGANQICQTVSSPAQPSSSAPSDGAGNNWWPW